MNKEMTGVLGILLIFLVGSASFDIVVSDTATTTTQFPLNAQTQLKFDSMKINPNPLGNAALWIWHSGNGTEATFQTLFQGHCIQYESTLTVKANSSFIAYLNGISVISTPLLRQAITYVNLQCGLNNLTIRVNHTDTQGAAVAFIVTARYYSTCIECQSNGYFDYAQCACACTTDNFTCPSPLHLKVGYPVCGCKCPNESFTFCKPNTQYFDRNSCGCKCFPRHCLPDLQQDSETCVCRCKAKTCDAGKFGATAFASASDSLLFFMNGYFPYSLYCYLNYQEQMSTNRDLIFPLFLQRNVSHYNP